uniref:Uncharacterized protein n=1 Tax=Anopheles minimus TaxID=112268 RepID=A0A182VQ38_9DIPT
MEEFVNCVLCLTTEPESFLKVYCDEKQSVDIAGVITKHLWLKPSNDAYVCNECWKCLSEFHEFYNRLEAIHYPPDPEDPSCNAKDIRQYLFEFHPVEDVKIEELSQDAEQLEEIEYEYLEDCNDESVENEAKHRISSRPKRASAAQANYKLDPADAEWEKDYLATNEDEYDEDENDADYEEDVKGEADYLEPDNDDSEVVNYDNQDVKPDVNVKKESLTPVKRGRGRPPKIKTEAVVSKPEPRKLRQRGRKKKQSVSSNDSELESDFDELIDSEDWKKYSGAPKRKRSKNPLGYRQLQEKMFTYVDEFTCFYCPEKVVFERFHHANLHFKKVHNEPAFLRCPKCGRKCFTPGGFVSHMETHEDPERNKCNICGKVTDQEITLKKHMRAHQVKLEKDFPYPCSQCTRRFEHEDKRDKHERLHGRNVVIKKEKGRDEELLEFYKRIYCDICEEKSPDSTSFDNFWNLKVHMSGEHNKTPYLKCPLCGKKYAGRQQLMVHVDVHNNPEHYRCGVCKEIHQNLDKHMIKAHTPETLLPDVKNYSCEHCGKMFKYQTNLRSHIDRVHGVKDVCCDICKKYFNHKALSAHKRSAHTDEMFMCEHCPKMFKTRSGLESHKSDHDETLRKSVKCTICGKEMRRGASMAKHMKTIHSQEDPVKCDLCGKMFRTTFHMLRHRANTCSATIDSRPYKCEVCGKGFAMKLTMTEHMTTHTRTSLYQCAFCFKTFGYISNLYKHRKKAHPLEWQEVQARPEQGIATKMPPNNYCALCLKTESKCFIDVFSDANSELDMALIISKHLWFDFNPTENPSVCSKCWTSVHDFHLFYTKLESIHSTEIVENYTIVQHTQEIDPYEAKKGDLLQENDNEQESEPDAPPATRKTSTRVTNLPLRYQTVADSSGKREKKHYVDVIDYASNDEDLEDYHSEDNMLDDDGEDDTLKIDHKLSTKDSVKFESDDVTVPEEQSPKQRRGRSSQTNRKQEATEKEIRLSVTGDVPKRPRGRPPKHKPNIQSTEENDSSIKDTKSPLRTATVHEPVKRGRGRPPKRSLEAANATFINAGVKIEIIDGNQPNTVGDSARRRTIRARKPKYESDSEQDDFSDYEDAQHKKKFAKRIRNDRDERIFKYVQEFCCHYCVDHVSFKRFIDADRHYKLVHNEPGFLKCTKCDKKCFTPGMFVSHMETHEDPEKNKCNICGKITDCNISLKKHMRVHLSQLEENLPFPCSRCKRKFESEEQRNKHEKLHVPKPLVKRDKGPDLELLAFYKRIYCDICEEQEPESTSFENFWDLRVHMEQEHNKGAYLKCPICNKRNLYRQHLITHIDLHNNPDKYRCEVCKEIYQNLDSHMIKAHTPTTAIPADKKYKCDQCGRMFNFLANLKMHIDCIHGSKDVRCNVCDKYFNLKAFRAHKRTAHTDQMLMCEHCPKMFKTRGALEVHKAIHDDTLVQYTTCKLCNKQIRQTNVKKHMTSQHSEDGPVNCELCGKIFRTMFHMKRHQKNTCEATINSRKHKCEVCGKGFCLKLTMIEHMTTHTGSNKYQCAFCFKSFGYISNLYKHRKKAHPLEWQEIQARPEEGISSVIVLKPVDHPYICIDCWNTVNEFHMYYTRLETIHNESVDIASDAVLDINELKDIEYLEEDTDELLQITNVKRTSGTDYSRESSDVKCNAIEVDGYRVVEIEVDDELNDTDYDDLPRTPDHRTKPIILNGRTKANIASESSTIAIDILESEEPAPVVKRGRGRPPKRKPEQQQSYAPTEVPGKIKKELNESGASAASAGSVAKRGRGRPPKSIKIEQNASYTAHTPRPIKKEKTLDSTEELTPDSCADGRPERRSTRVRKIKHYSDMEQASDDEGESDEHDPEYVLGEDPDYEARLELQRQLDMDDYSFYEYQCSLESEQVARDDKIFRYVEEFPCYLCTEKVTFKRFADAHLHYRVEHNQPPFLKCPKCDKKCHTPGMFVSHMETHDDPEKNKCEICGKFNDCNISLKKHMRVHQSQLEENLPYPCSLCKRKFESEDLRTKHELLHVPKPYVPNEKGPDQEVLNFYKSIVCDICEEETSESASFDNLSDLRAHMVKEHNKNICELCNEVYQNLHHHMLKAHPSNTTQSADNAKHKCDQCGRTFRFLANLKMHIDCVHGLKDVRCNICDKYFNFRAYRAHKRTAHTDLMLMCEHCPRMFKNRKSFEAHKAFHDSSLLRMSQCTLCGKQIRTCSMSKHMKTIHSEDDPVNCDLCGKMFRTPFHMKRHQKNTCEVTMDSRSFKCEVCGKGFSTKLTMVEHMTTHTRTNQYQCAFCFKSFGYISNLYKHRKKAHPQEWQEVQAHPEENIPRNECSICQHNIIGTQRLETLCGHTFHRHCLVVWMRTYAFCPDCPRRM